MAKDAKGHGSESRGGSMGRSEFASQPHQGAKFQARQSMKAANSPDSWEARYGTQMDRDRLRADAINQGVDAGFKSSLREAGLSPVSGGQPVASNAHAAATLAGGPKSAAVDTHPAMADAAGLAGRNWGSPRDPASYNSGGPRNAQGYRTTGTAYEGPRPSMTSSGKRFNPNTGTGKFERFK
jgi:hypothetical protein